MASFVRGPAGNNECRIYVGNLPPDTIEEDIEEMFYQFGSIAHINLKDKGPPSFPFAFVQFYDWRAAEDAVQEVNGFEYCGKRIQVNFSRGQPPPRKSSYRCIVSDLPSTGTWKDLWDHMCPAGEVCYAYVYRDGTGVVEFYSPEDMKYAVKMLDGSKFTSHKREVSYICVKVDPTSGGVGFSPSPTGKSYRCIVSDMPSTTSRRDLEDQFSWAGDVCYAHVYRDGTGVVEYHSPEDMKYAVKTLDGSRFTSQEGDVSYICVRVDQTSECGRRSPRPFRRGDDCNTQAEKTVKKQLTTVNYISIPWPYWNPLVIVCQPVPVIQMVPVWKYSY